jgi:hypothetical protein
MRGGAEANLSEPEVERGSPGQALPRRCEWKNKETETIYVPLEILKAQWYISSHEVLP